MKVRGIVGEGNVMDASILKMFELVWAVLLSCTDWDNGKTSKRLVKGRRHGGKRHLEIMSIDHSQLRRGQFEEIQLIDRQCNEALRPHFGCWDQLREKDVPFN